MVTRKLRASEYRPDESAPRLEDTSQGSFGLDMNEPASDAKKLKLSDVVLGTMGFSEPGQTKDIPILHEVIERGITSLDTAPLYGAGESEKIVGKAIKDRRDKVQVLTKCGLNWDSDHGEPLFSVERNGRMWTPRRNSRPQALLTEIEQSLRRLGTDYIDLIQVHHWDRTTPIEASMDALLEAQKAGKVREIGISNYPLQQLRAAHRHLGDKLFSTQNQYNLLQPHQEQALLDYSKKNGIRFLAYSPLAHGLLGGRLLHEKPEPDWRANGAYRHPKNVERVNTVLREVAQPLARDHNVTLAQLTLLWALKRQGVTSVIIGGKNRAQLLDSSGAISKNVPVEDLKRFENAIRQCGFELDPGLSTRGKVIRVLQKGKAKLGRLKRLARPF